MRSHEYVVRLAASILRHSDPELAAKLDEVDVPVRDGGPYFVGIYHRQEHPKDGPAVTREYLMRHRAMDDMAEHELPECPLWKRLMITAPELW